MRWNPWRAARERENLVIEYADLSCGAAWFQEGGRDVIVIDASADRRTRRALLAHELIHAERGIGFPAASPAVMQREEAAVRRETAVRLVPLDELAGFVARVAGLEAVTAALVGDEFDVPEPVAAEALRALAVAQGHGRRPMPER
jgi:hypothetical protein